MDQEMLMANLADELEQMGANPEMLDMIIQVIEHVLQNPQDYEAVLMQAVQDGLVDQGDLPDQFDEGVMAALLQALMQVKEQIGQRVQQFAKGGLASLGRGGDTRLAHINDMEAEVLRRMGGSGSVNPNTGLEEFKGGGLKSVIKAVAPIALAVFAPGIGTALGSALGAGAAWAPTVGNMVLGGLTGAVTGGGLKGALKGAALGGLGSLAGQAFSGGPMPWDAAGAGSGVGAGMSGSAGSDFSSALQGAGANTSSIVNPATAASNVTVTPITGAGFSPSVNLMTSPGASPFMTSLGRGAESLALGAKGLANSPMMQTLKSGLDIGRTGLGAISDYKTMNQQEEMANLEKQYMEQMLAQGMSPEQAQQQYQQMYGGNNSAFGAVGMAGAGNAFGQVSPSLNWG